MKTVGQLPLCKVVAIPVHATLDEAYSELLAHDAAELYVIDERQNLVGIVPDYELLKARLAGDAEDATVDRIMSSHVLCYTTDTPIEVALADFRSGFRTRAAVLKRGQLVGQITRSTLLRAICEAKTSRVPRPKFHSSELARNALMLLNGQPA